MKGKIIHIGNDAYIVKRKFDSNFEKVIKQWGIKEITENLNCDKVVKTNNNSFLLVEKIEEAQILNIQT